MSALPVPSPMPIPRGRGTGVPGFRGARPGAVALTFALAMALGSTVHRADAHAYLVRSDPEAGQALASAPATIRLWFTEAPEPRFTTVQVLSPGGVELQSATVSMQASDPTAVVAVVAPVPDGGHVISWKTISAVDGHESAGSFPIGVGSGPEVEAFLGSATVDSKAAEATAPRTALRTLTYLGSSLAIGAPTFAFLVLGPVLARRRTMSPVPRDHARGSSAGTSPTREGEQAASPVREASMPHGWYETTLARRDHATLAASLARPTWLVTAIGLAASAGALAWAIVALAAEGAGTGPAEVLAEGVGAGSPLATLLFETRFGQAAIGRGAALAGLGVMLFAARDRHRARPDGAAGRRRWVGMAILAGLASATTGLTSHAAARPLGTGSLAADLVHLVASGTWVGGVLALVVTIARARTVIGSGHEFRRLVSDLVERFSQVAGACVAALVLTGAWQTWVLAGSLDAILGTSHGWALVLKVALVTGLLVVAAINFGYVRPRLRREALLPDPASPGAPSAGIGAIGVLEATTGVAEVLMVGTLVVTGAITQLPPARDAHADATRGTFSEASADGVRLRLRLDPGRPGYNAATLWASERAGPLAGASARLVVRMVDHDMGDAEVRLSPRADGSHAAGTNAIGMTGTYEVVAIMRRSGHDDVRATFAPVAIAGEGATAPVRPAVPEARGLTNPVAATAGSLDRGRLAYLQSCAACHGVTGRGDGAGAVAIRPAPADLNVHVPVHPDGELWWFITNGVAGRPMPAWRDAMTDDERWDVVNYLRATFGSRPARPDDDAGASGGTGPGATAPDPGR